MFEEYKVGGKLLGFSARAENSFFFFGSRHMSREALPEIFPEYKFAFLKQVHGRAVLLADPAQTLEADAHFTTQPRLALVSQSADCVPILLSDSKTVIAVHAGWKGMAQNIVGAVHETLPAFKPTIAAIGPHILFNSFEVGLDVSEKLGGKYTAKHSDPGKVYFDLAALARKQLADAFGPVRVEECLRDTLTDTELHSFRRGKEKASRQFSFVVIDS